MEGNMNDQPDYATTLINRGAPLKQTSKLNIKYTKSSFQTNNFCTELRDANIGIQTLKMKDSLLLWIGKATQPEFSDMAIAMKSSFEQDTTSAKILGPSLDSTSVNLANKLSKKLGKQVYVSCNIQLDMISLPQIEKCIVDEFKRNQEIF